MTTPPTPEPAVPTPISNKHAGYFATHRHAMPIFDDMIVMERDLALSEAANAAMREALQSLMDTHDEDIGMEDYADEVSVGTEWNADGSAQVDMKLTFGVLRRARKTPKSTTSGADLLREMRGLRERCEKAEKQVETVKRCVDISERLLAAQTDKQAELSADFSEAMAYTLLDKEEAKTTALTTRLLPNSTHAEAMTTHTKLDAGNKHILKLIARDRKPDGWTTVSKTLYRVLSTSIPTDLATFEQLEDGTGRAKLTEEGQKVVDAMAWL